MGKGSKSQTGGSHTKIEKRVWIRATADIVFRALTDSKELARWFCDRATSDPREGGELVAHWSTGKSSFIGRALYQRIIRPSALELVWIDDGKGEQPSSARHTLRYEIRNKSEMTEVLMLDEDENPSDDEALDTLDQGWNAVLLELKEFCERRQRSVKIRPHGSKEIDPE